MSRDRETLLASLPGFPPELLPKWTLGMLRDRVVMVAQFNCGRFTFEEALFEALNRVQVAPEIWAWWDDEMRAYATECNRRANAGHAAVMNHLNQKEKPEMPSATKAKPAPPPPAPSEPPLQLNGQVALAEIRPCPFNVRRAFDGEDLRGLAESIDRIGLKDPLLVRPFDAKGEQVPLSAKEWRKKTLYFELADGERRFRALTLLAESKEVPPVPVIVRNLADEEVRAIMLASREQSRELSASELVAGYVELSRGKSAGEVAAMVGRPVGHVRSVLRLAKLPAWALAAVDAGTLPRATAELVARVPGEESRKKAAACVLWGVLNPAHLLPAQIDTLESLGEKLRADYRYTDAEPLSYRDTKELIRTHFTVELKGAPFSRKELYVWPGCEPGHERNMPDCDTCPSRAGNDPEAVAEKVRADVCLDPDCYSAKVQAYRAKEVAKAEKKGVLPVPDDFPQMGAHAPKGWCELSTHFGQTEVGFGVSLPQSKSGKTLEGLLGDNQPQHYLAFDQWHKKRLLVKATDARKALVELGVLKKPEKQPRQSQAERTAAATARANGTAPKKAGPSPWDVDREAAEIAAKALGEYTEGQCVALDPFCEGVENDPIRSAIELACRAVCYEWSRSREGEQLLREWVCPDGDFDEELDAAIRAMPPSRALGLLVAVVTWWEVNDGPNRDTGKSLLAFAELDWPQLQEQARRELSGGDPAEAKVAKAEAAAGDTVENGLLRALHSFEGVDEEIAAIRKSGADDATLRKWIGDRFGISGGGGSPGLTDISFKGGSDPRFWFGTMTHNGQPTLKGKALVDAMRKLLDVPFPVPPEAEPPAQPQPPAGTPLAGIPKFPPVAAEHLARHGIATLEGLYANRDELRKQKGKGEASVYTAMRELNVPGEAVLDAGDAVTDFETAQIEAAEAAKEPKAKKKGVKAK